MIMYKISRSLLGAFAACLITAGALTGCSDNAASPLPPDTDPLGNNATVETSDPVSPQEANEVRTNAQKHANDSIVVQPNDAATTARSEYPGCDVMSVNLDYDRDTLYYEVIVRSNGKYYIVKIDPQSGDVIEKSELDADKVKIINVIIIRQTTVKVKEAKDRATKVIKGDCIEVNLEEIDGRQTYVIIILTSDNRYVTVYVDGETGRERKLNESTTCDQKDSDKDSDSDGPGRKDKKGRGHYRHGQGKGYGHKYHCHCECTDDDNKGIPDSLLTIDSAKAITRTMIDSVTFEKVQLSVLDTTSVYDLTLSRDSNTYVLRLNAKTGALVEASQTGGNFDSSEFRPRVTGDTLVALSVARTAAIAQVIGTIQGWKLSYSIPDAKWIYVFTIKETSSSSVKKVVVDAKTGVYMRTE